MVIFFGAVHADRGGSVDRQNVDIGITLLYRDRVLVFALCWRVRVFLETRTSAHLPPSPTPQHNTNKPARGHRHAFRVVFTSGADGRPGNAHSELRGHPAW